MIDLYTDKYPSPANAISLFEGQWTSHLPGVGGGQSQLFEDPRIIWLEQQVGTFAGMNILECGPLEGAHTFMLSMRGAAHILSIEANRNAFLRCLLVKNLYNLKNATFLFGDFVPFLSKASLNSYDFVLATGILYHMINPHIVLSNILSLTNRVGMWTHYFDPSIIFNNERIKDKFSKNPSIVDDFKIPIIMHKQSYNHDISRSDFCGGSEQYSHWMSRDSILKICEHHGFSVSIAFEEPYHPHGPCFQIYAEKHN